MYVDAKINVPIQKIQQPYAVLWYPLSLEVTIHRYVHIYASGIK